MSDVVENLNDLAKEVYAEGKIPNLIPNGVKLQTKIKFKASEKTGDKYVEAVRLAYPNGFTHEVGDGTAGAFSLRGAKKGIQKKAEIQPYQLLLQDQMSYEDASKIAKGKQAFVDGVGYILEGMQISSRKRLEGLFFYGQSGIGVIDGTPDTDGSNRVITISEGEWASGFWVGNEGMTLDAYDGATLINENADLVLEEVNAEDRKITVSGNSTDLGNLADTHTLYFGGAKDKEMAGIHKILSNTGSLFNIDASVYSLWKSTQHSAASAPLTFQKTKKAISKAVNKGLEDDIEMFVNPESWDDIANDVAALRRTSGKDVKKVEVGHEEIVFHSQNGKISLVPSIYVKRAHSFGMTLRHWKRIGSQDLSSKTPGFGDKLFFQLQDKAGVELRMYANQAIFCYCPAKQLYVNEIVPSA